MSRGRSSAVDILERIDSILFTGGISLSRSESIGDNSDRLTIGNRSRNPSYCRCGLGRQERKKQKTKTTDHYVKNNRSINFDFKFIDPKIDYYPYNQYEKLKDEAIRSIGTDKEDDEYIVIYGKKVKTKWLAK